MAGNKGKESVLYGKVVILVLGFVAFGLGVHSHFQSAWMQTPDFGLGYESKLYEICKLKEIFEDPDLSCPPISLERYFVAVVTVCFTVSGLILVGGFLILQTPLLRTLDVCYNLISLVLLFIAGLAYIASANQINDLFKDIDPAGNFNFEFYRLEKLQAGMLAILLSLVHGVVAVLLLKKQMSGSARNEAASHYIANTNTIYQIGQHPPTKA